MGFILTRLLVIGDTDGNLISANIKAHDSANQEQEHFDKVLVAVGRKPKTGNLGFGTTDIELTTTVEDIAETIYPHPSLSESLKEAARQIIN